MNKREVKSVCFNLSDPWEKEMYDYAMSFKKFSTFVKRLIQNAMSEKGEVKQAINPVPIVEKSPIKSTKIQPEQLRQFI